MEAINSPKKSINSRSEMKSINPSSINFKEVLGGAGLVVGGKKISTNNINNHMNMNNNGNSNNNLGEK